MINAETLKRIKHYFEKGLNATEIAKLLGISARTCQRYLKTAGIGWPPGLVMPKPPPASKSAKQVFIIGNGPPALPPQKRPPPWKRHPGRPPICKRLPRIGPNCGLSGAFAVIPIDSPPLCLFVQMRGFCGLSRGQDATAARRLVRDCPGLGQIAAFPGLLLLL